MNWNTRWYLDLNSIARHTGWAHGMATAYAVAGGLVVLGTVLATGWFLARHHSPRKVGASLSAWLAAVVGFLINQPISNVIAERRPYQTLHHVLVLVPRVRDFSMPSDHAVVAGAVIAGVLLYNWRLGLAAIAAGLALAFDRVYVGAHYPGDILAGLGLGAVVAICLYTIIVPPLAAVAAFLAKTPLRPLVAGSTSPRRP
ncbi:MAG: phosphatase PAP2 family protein [Candidatus Dormiibacterota bacterium]